MHKVFSFEKLEVYKLARTLNKRIYQITSDFPKQEKYCLVVSPLASRSMNLSMAVAPLRHAQETKT